jgi:chemotaxis protein methyltransferase WspC
MKPIEDRLRETIGLDAACVGPSLIERAVRHRMRSLGLRRTEDYRQFLEHSHAEWHELVEAVVVTETWFFRDPDPITAFVRLVREQWLPAPGSPDVRTAPLRLLSVPCSSGEEPFSLVMALLDAGVPADRFQIEAVDISARALARAARGIYGRNSFRGKDFDFRDRYFQPSGQNFVLDPAVRGCVRFWQGNFLNDAFLSVQAGYDFIFCRNLLIYFDPLMRRKALDKLERLLAPGGVLFVGPVEQPLAIEHGFVMAGIPMAFACRKADHGVRRESSAWLSKQPNVAARFQLKRGFQTRLKSNSRLRLPSSGKLSRSRCSDLDTARRLADAGRLQEAGQICQAHLNENRTSAQAYYLLGLVRDASGQPDAIDCYRKALYLEPNHYESLLQMALLLQKHGDAARARTFSSRAQRLKLKE